MSDSPQGPDWWLASDRKWYPPQSRPAPLPPPPPPPPPPPSPFSYAPTPWQSAYHPTAAPVVKPASVSSALTGWLQALMWATGGVAALTGVIAFIALARYQDFIDERAGSSAERDAYWKYIDAHNWYANWSALMYVLAIAMFVLTVIWTNKAHNTTQRLCPGTRRWSSGWTVGAWFIPLANYFIPKMVLNEIERIATARRWNGMVDTSWRREPTSVLGWLWWIGTALGFLAALGGSGLTEETNASNSDIQSGWAIAGLGGLGLGVALAIGAIYVRRVGSRLSPRGVAQEP